MPRVDSNTGRINTVTYTYSTCHLTVPQNDMIEHCLTNLPH